ncbi:MAG: L-rhamnose mutarotase [Planctomycetia bacterium]|nr:L-rhamnose mutarotase [Planctomycetia bacterium]
MRWMWLVLLGGMVGMTGCEQIQEYLQPTAKEETAETAAVKRPVTKRLCAMVMIGNLGERELSLEEMETTPPTSEKERVGNELNAILNDASLSEEEKTERIDALIQAQKAKLTPEELRELEAEKKSSPASGDDVETEVGSSSTSGTENAAERKRAETSILNREIRATSTATSESEEVLEETPADEEAPAEIESLIEDTLTRVLEESAAKPSPKKPDGEEVDLTEKVQRPRPVVEQITRSPGLEEVEQLYAQQAEAFLQLNKNLPDKVKEEIQATNFQNYSVWMAQASDGNYYAVRYIEYVGNQFDLDYLTLIRSPEYKKWMRSQEPYLRQMSSLMSLDVWLEMGEVWHCD